VHELVPCESLVQLQEGSGPPTFLVHPIEGSVKALRGVAQHLQGAVYGLQCSASVPMDSVQAIAAHYIQVHSTFYPQLRAESH
jgi:hypothetical protein